MIVTVQETIEHSRDITADMVEAYMRRRGWIVTGKTDICVRLGNARSPRHWLMLWRDGRRLSGRVKALAKIEDRKPHEVLADIAEGR